MFVYSLISAWKMGLCLTHLHPEELHLVRNKKIVLHNRNFAPQAHLFTVEAKSSKATRRCYLESRFSKWAVWNPHHIHNCLKSPRCLGERWRMVVPPHLAYGDSGAGDSIPGQSAEKFPNYQDQNFGKLPPLIDRQDADYRWSHPHI